MSAPAKYTGVPLLPSRFVRWLGFWSRRDQKTCPHPDHRERIISGDERQYGFRRQCMDCGLLLKEVRV